MKAAVFERVGTITVRNVPDPECDAGGMVVRVKACGICGSDARNFRAGLRTGATGQVMGHEIAAVVERVGPACTRFHEGDAVAVAPDVSCGVCRFCARGLVNLCLEHRMIGTHWPGGFAEMLALPGVVVERGILHLIPDGLDFRHAALAEPLASVLAAQETAGIGPGRSVAVFGDGPVGCLHVQVARWRGASPVILAGRRRLALAAAFHPDLAVNVASEDPVSAIRAATGGRGADVAIIATPAAVSQEQGLGCVDKRGTVILFGGLPRGDPYVRLDANRIHYDEIRLVGSFSYTAREHAAALEAIRDGRIAADALITRVVPLDGIVEAIQDSESGKVLKVVVDPWM